MLFTNLVQANLKTRVLGQRIEYYTRLESTNKEAWKIIKDGAKSGTVVITDNQVSGKGRGNRQWIASPDKSLTFSLLLFSDLDASLTGWLPILSGVAVKMALMKFNMPIQLKWPNDLIFNRKKVGGILCESKVKENELKQIVIGIGLNVNETMDDFDDSIQSTATSLHIAMNKFYQRERILAEILNALESLIKGMPNNCDLIRSEWESACGHMNKPVEFHHGAGLVNGVFKSLGNAGSAIINHNGKESEYYSGEIFESIPI